MEAPASSGQNLLVVSCGVSGGLVKLNWRIFETLPPSLMAGNSTVPKMLSDTGDLFESMLSQVPPT